MFPANLSLAVLFILSFFHGDLFINAIPTTSSSVLPRMASVTMGPPETRRPYELELLSTQGFFSRAYEVVGGYQGTPAILKLIPKGPQSPKTKIELNNLSKVGLYLWSETNNAHSFFVMKDVRKDYPNPGDVKKLFPDWYLEDENMDVVQQLSTVQNNLHNVLMDFALDEKNGLMHYDCHMNNIYTDNVFKKFMPVDWGPPDNEARKHGAVTVIPGPETQASSIASYMNWLDDNLPQTYSLQALSDILAARGQQLRPADAQLLAQQNARN